MSELDEKRILPCVQYGAGDCRNTDYIEQLQTSLAEWAAEARQMKSERDSLASQLAALRAEREAMREAMGEEWEQDEVDVTGDDVFPFCRECERRAFDRHGKPNAHSAGCSRGRFFAALAAAQSQDVDRFCQVGRHSECMSATCSCTCHKTCSYSLSMG